MFTLFDAGCGVGNGFYPLLREFPTFLRIDCCDFSPRAVDFVKKHELYKDDQVDAKTCDLVNEEIPFAKGTANFAIHLFVLSAISPENYVSVVKKIYD
jgi:methyltransferase-like protein 6